MGLLLPGLGLFGTLITTRKRKLLNRKSMVGMSLLCLLLFVSLFTLGCGGSKSSNSNSQSTPASQVSVMVTGTSGSLSHSSAVTVTIK
jgi:hypothetical protein